MVNSARRNIKGLIGGIGVALLVAPASPQIFWSFQTWRAEREAHRRCVPSVVFTIRNSFLVKEALAARLKPENRGRLVVETSMLSWKPDPYNNSLRTNKFDVKFRARVAFTVNDVAVAPRNYFNANWPGATIL
jgi:hypothetical protein